jgi:hypothetical protein
MAWPGIVRATAFAAGIVLIGWGFVERYSFSRLKSTGVAASAMPASPVRESHSSRGSTRYLATVEFTTAQGQRIGGEREIPSALLAEVRAQRPVTVRYEAANPANFVFEEDSAPWSFVIAGVILITVAAVRK